MNDGASNPLRDPSAAPELGRVHRARLLQIWRSAGWPHRDPIDLDLLAAALVTVHWQGDTRETLRLTQAGIEWLAAARNTSRRAVGPHDRLAARVADKLMESGRLVWRELSLRARVEPSIEGAAGDAATQSAITAAAWRMARPDVFSIRNTSVETYLHPIVHEVKVSRADLLGDLRKPAKREAYRWLCCECYYVFPAGLAKVEEIPEDFGVWLLHGDIDTGVLESARAAKHSACALPFAVWMALARSMPSFADPQEQRQGELGEGLD